MGIDNNDPLDFIVSQVRSNIEFLQSKGRISSDAAIQISNLLANNSLAAQPQAVSAFPQARVAPPVNSPPFVKPSPPARPQYAKALYNYNAPGDLNFRVGDVIELVPRPADNDDWWTGRLNGREGLFPSNHVERLPSSAPPPSTSPYDQKGPIQGYNSPQPPQGYQGPSPPQGYQTSPPQGYYPPPGPPGPPGPSATVHVIHEQQQPPEDGKKKSKLGKIGGTVGNAAAGGLGFGAGAAIGSGIINSIF